MFPTSWSSFVPVFSVLVFFVALIHFQILSDRASLSPPLGFCLFSVIASPLLHLLLRTLLRSQLSCHDCHFLDSGHHKIPLDSSRQAVAFGSVDPLSDIFGFPFRAALLGLWGFTLFILADFLERQKWLKMITMLCMGIYDIQSPYTELNFNEICVNESETHGFHPP